MTRKRYSFNRPTSKDIIHYDMRGKPACGIDTGRIFVTWVHEQVECIDCLRVMNQEHEEWLGSLSR